jgi:hypothetical protein
MAQALGVIDIIVSGKSSKHRLPQQADERMVAVPAGARIGKHITCHGAETEGVVEFAIGQQSGIGDVPRAIELKLRTAVEIEPQNAIIRFTPLVRRGGLVLIRLNY